MTRISHFKIGLFFLVSIFLATGALFWIGSTKYFQKTKTYVTYFDQSVQGLSTSSSVKYLGLKVGEIAKLELAPNNKNLVRVVMKLDSGFKVKKSMAIQKNIKGITGQSCLAIVEAPSNLESVTPKIDFSLQFPIIPSVPGQIEQIQIALKHIYSKFESTNIQKLFTKWGKVAQNTNAIIDDSQINKTLKNINQVSKDLKKVSQRLKIITQGIEKPKAVQSWRQTFTNLAQTAKSAQHMSHSLKNQIDSLEPDTFSHLAQNLNNTITTLQTSVQSTNYQLTKSLRHLQESLAKLNQTLAEIQALSKSIRIQPGRILSEPKEKEPFNQ